jgi:hypothetical protein
MTMKTWSTVILASILIASPAGAQPAGAPASQPASGPASQPAAAPAKTTLAGEARLQRLERSLKRQQGEIKELKGTSDDLSDQLEELSRPQRTFSIYGFTDINFLKLFVPDDVIGSSLMPQEPTFVFGNLNLYFDFTPHTSWRVLTEIRLTLNPLGDTVTYENAATGQAYERADVTTRDSLHYSSSFSLGSVAIERAQVEWMGFEWLNVTLGLFLSPIGIWNIDHGSPAQLRVASPNAYVNHRVYGAFFPERQLGLMLHGSVPLGGLRLGYALTLTNGGGPVNNLGDFDADKAVGARVQLSGSGDWRWKVGLSGYTGMWSDFKFVIQTSPKPDYVREYTVRYRESILALDTSLEAGPLLVNAELLANWRSYHDDYRPPALDGAGAGLAPDAISLGSYVLLGYRLPLTALNVLAFTQVGYVDRNDTTDNDDVGELALGLNWQIRANVVLKLEWVWFHWTNVQAGQLSIFSGIGDMHTLQTQLAVAF